MFTKRSNSLVLEQAIAVLMQNQAAFLSQSIKMQQRMAELEENIEKRFRRIEVILLRHEQILNDLPEAIRQKIGFNPAS